MAYLNKDYILQKVTDNKLIYWKVEAAGQGHPIDQQREEISILEKRQQIRRPPGNPQRWSYNHNRQPNSFKRPRRRSFTNATIQS
jgi:hypothetical protein